MTCHSQLVRFTEDDVRRFGPASQAWESDGDTPQMWGTRRIGPDLARESGRRPTDWQLAHLWNPRHVVPDSVMPGYPWLFEGSAARPTQGALDLVRYLDSLGRDARLAGLGSPTRLAGRDPAEERRKGMFCDCAIPRTAGKAPVWDTALALGEVDRFARRGAAVFARECAGCHGSTGRGDGPASVVLTPVPRDLTGTRFSDRRLSESLWNGVRGSSMPAWNELSAGDLRGLVAFLGTIAPDEPAPVLSSEEESTARNLFTRQCAVCHGRDGRGDGPSAATLVPRPTDFHEARPSSRRAEGVLSQGIRGTAMPRWEGKLSLAEQKLIARYVRSFFSQE